VTLNKNLGLTYAKPNYPIAFLMDNTEVWYGLKQFSDLLYDMSDSDADYYYNMANYIRTNIENKLYNKMRGEYYSNLDSSGNGNPINWYFFYPDAVANLWPMIFKLPEAIEKNRRELIYKKFMSIYRKKWINLTIEGFADSYIAEVVKLNNESDVIKSFANNVMKKYYPY
jgi:hypothetical protein